MTTRDINATNSIKRSHGTVVSDFCGAPLSCKSPECPSLFEESVLSIVGWSGKRFEEPLKQALDLHDPDFVMAKVLLGLDHPQYLEDYNSLMQATAVDREKKHVEAAYNYTKGYFRKAAQLYESILLDHPTDILALKLATDIYIAIGDVENLRNCPARVFQVWNEDFRSLPTFGTLLGMYAFGLEENNIYLQAEEIGNKALELVPMDAWAAHAIAHVYEMEQRQWEGISFLKRTERLWKDATIYRSHNYWHLALYYMEMEQYDQVLQVFDRCIRSGRPHRFLDLIDASSILFRLQMDNVEIGDRWQEVMECWKPKLQARTTPFSDLHMTMAMVGCHDNTGAWQLIEWMKEFGNSEDILRTSAQPTREIGIPIAESLLNWRDRKYTAVTDCLWSVKPHFSALGGSIAQRDIFDLMLIKSSLKCSRIPIARSLLSERLQQRPKSPQAWKMYSSLLEHEQKLDKAEQATQIYKMLLAPPHVIN